MSMSNTEKTVKDIRWHQPLIIEILTWIGQHLRQEQA
jgi:hypothetical protein